MKVPRFSQKAFEQAAGFLRVPESENPLDNTSVHPESYSLLEERAGHYGKSLAELVGAGVELLRQDEDFKAKAGAFTAADILARGDIVYVVRTREVFVPFSYRDDIHELKDLKPGMHCPGIVTNVANFGAFVDIGVHQDGLVHLSQLASRFVKDPGQVVSPGDRVMVTVLEVNLEKNQIALSMKAPQAPAAERREPRRDRDSRQAKGGKRSGRPQPPRQGARPPRPPKPLFNDAFAALAGLRDQLKPKK